MDDFINIHNDFKSLLVVKDEARLEGLSIGKAAGPQIVKESVFLYFAPMQ
jgi:hypothetical protein